MTDRPLHIAWFRQDLRLADNPALYAAAGDGDVLPIYILDDANAGDAKMGAASRAWLHRSLADLDRSLGGALRFFAGDASRIIAELVDSLPVASLSWNRSYEPWRRLRDAAIEKHLAAQSIEARVFNGSLLWEPERLLNQNGSPYRVFTPFYRNACLAQAPPPGPLSPPADLRCSDLEIAGALSLDDLHLWPRHDWAESMLESWQIGEQAARRRLDEFCMESVNRYPCERDFPALDATSKLSPHLHFGEISPRQVWHRVEAPGGATDDGGDGPPQYLRQLLWREFSYYLLFHYPDLPSKNFNSRFDAFEWLPDDGRLDRWRRGQTGFPLVDAGMRELWQTGYMHNRVRMLVASLLVKNMLIDWRVGADWFNDCLVDADLANNSASWQWCAGSGADAAPYFRIFNPLLQSEKFDPGGEYIARYCPELEPLPAALRHQPWQADDEALRAAGITMGVDYPLPMLDLKGTRERALLRYKQLG